MDPKKFSNLATRKRFARDQIKTISPSLHFACSIMEKHEKTDSRQSGRYNLLHLIEKIADLNLENVKLDELTTQQKDAFTQYLCSY